MNKPKFRAALAGSLILSAILIAACGGSDSDTTQSGSSASSSSASSVEPTPTGLTLSKIGGFQHDGGASSAEITAYDPLSKRLFVVNGALGTVDVLNLADPTAPTLISSISTASFGSGLGGVNSVAVHDGVVALTIEANPKTSNGIAALLRASDLVTLGTASVGALPDMLTFTPDGKTLLVANEGEPSSYDQSDSIDPEGSISVIALGPLGPTVTSVSMTATQAGFTAYNSQIDSLRAAGVRIFGPNASVAQDLEPEYITVAADSSKAWITLQENNAVAELDIASKTITAIRPFGLKDHSLAGNGMDVSDEDGGENTNNGTPAIKIRTVPVKGMYMPDAIASYTVGGETYLVTANEGDAREYDGFAEKVRVRAHCDSLDATAFADAANAIRDSNLGRLKITANYNGGSIDTGKDTSGTCTALYSFGARSFSIWKTDARQVYDSGDEFEQRTQALSNVNFNASNDNDKLDARSTAKGPEPEGVVLGHFGGKTYAFIGLERVGGVMVYDITTPAAPAFVTYVNPRAGETGDRGPEGLAVVPAADSPNGKPLLIVGNETSGSTAIYQIDLSY
ncbi:MAG: alkaline phosphatase [Candidatus Dactylopiibacterium carminicum]|uniref:Alkaline phosphatase n=1 Tax=Candidatus Dactylopiibacterium carminicum TaxID=857335 RepID=A0A272EY91_9RHOO|nr:choice-of-anchor I family protein [Candidatus Dactylopiibacterium carminicum]KAF7600450.1 alkaline phosphatase [Candidatus Dactylopiibacterium carminicum]PAS95071.1 MAG: alkaline phosphatase [Candidatus Dactylopiibacterium carminicum]PAS97822.1 MAG: alkaline phosphatase [Candidatus Dactylopiibacterium carminicum]PAT00447.1 MAG: alkaline phosphatase [Candidatus Dactylopiibacterium carminicum]